MSDTHLEQNISKRKTHMSLVTKWWKLKDVKQSIFEERVRAQIFKKIYGDSNMTLDNMASNLKTVAKSTLSESRK